MRRSLVLIVTAIAFFGCSNLTPTQKALLTSAQTIASVAATAAATYYGGPQAGQLASAGLSALGSVLQGYVGATVPATIIQNSPGIAGVGQAVALILPTRVVSQKTVDTVNKAAALAATFKESNILPLTPQPAASPSPAAVTAP